MSDYDDDAPEPLDADAVSKAIARVEQLKAEAEQIAAHDPTTGGALVPVGDGTPEAVKQRLAAQRSLAKRKATELDAATKELRDLLDRQVSAARAAMAPLQKQMARLQEGIDAVNLYLGRDEQLVVLRRGEPAPADEPITLRQMVLAMDEESAVAAERGGMDAQQIDKFDEWLLADPANLEQVLPEQKGIVVLTPRAKSRDYGDPWVNTQMDAANKHSHWLIRNGQMLYSMSTDFVVGKRLVAAKDEFTGFFQTTRYNFTTRESETVQLDPGSYQWLEAEEAADARRRHFMKVALILEGLLHRTKVFEPLPDPDVSFIKGESYDNGWVRIVSDAELALGTGREPFYEWLARLNAQLTVGMRIVGNFRGEAWRGANNDYDQRRFQHTRLSPPSASTPESGVVLPIEDKRADGSLVVRYARSDKKWETYWEDNPDRPGWGWDRRREVPYEKRASVRIRKTDRFILPFDLVTVAEMEAYLSARTDRHAYEDMFPVLRAAIAAKHAEAEAEAPFRTMLAGVLARENNVTVEDAQEAIPALVDWFKLANKHHRPLIGDDDAQALAVRRITTEHRQRLADTAAADGVADALAATYPDFLLIAIKRDGHKVVLVPHDDGPFVQRYTITKTGKTTRTLWILVGTAWHQWNILRVSDAWATWAHSAELNNHLTGPELDNTVAEILELAAATEHGAPVAVTLERKAIGGVFTVYHDDFVEKHYRKSWFSHIAEPAVVFNRPLTKPLARPDTPTTGYEWRRGPQRRVVVTANKWRHSDSTWSTAMHSDALRPPWESAGNHVEVVWQDDAAAATLIAQHAAFTTREASHDPTRARYDAALASISDAWQANAEAEARRRFDEDYGDPDQWEQHRANLDLRYPYWGTPGQEQLDEAIARFIETDTPFDGLTVTEALALYASLPRDVDPDDGEDNDDDPAEPTPARDDIANLVIRDNPTADPNAPRKVRRRRR